MTVFKVGHRLFQLGCLDEALHDAIAEFVPVSPGQITGTTLIPEAASQPSDAMAAIVANLLSEYQNLLWFDAATLITTTGQTVMIAGPSHSGKTTLALALALAHDWKIVCEDITFIDQDRFMVAPLPAPLSLRPGTLEMVQAATGHRGLRLLANEWFYDASLYRSNWLPAKIDLVIVSEEIDNHCQDQSLENNTMDEAQTCRELLPLSNALRLANGIATTLKLLQPAIRLKIRGGDLKQRLSLIEALSR